MHPQRGIRSLHGVKYTSGRLSISIGEGNALAALPEGSGALEETEPAIRLRMPVAADGPAITALIAACPPLDGNSAYCNLLQCTDFADTGVVAERDGAIVGWISGYRPPSRPEELFIWQVAVAVQARGERLASRMLDHLAMRPQIQPIAFLSSTVTAANRASWALFEAFARSRQAPLKKTVRFDRTAHFADAHDTEWCARIGPFRSAATDSAEPNSSKEST